MAQVVSGLGKLAIECSSMSPSKPDQLDAFQTQLSTGCRYRSHEGTSYEGVALNQYEPFFRFTMADWDRVDVLKRIKIIVRAVISQTSSYK